MNLFISKLQPGFNSNVIERADFQSIEFEEKKINVALSFFSV